MKSEEQSTAELADSFRDTINAQGMARFERASAVAVLLASARAVDDRAKKQADWENALRITDSSESD